MRVITFTFRIEDGIITKVIEEPLPGPPVVLTDRRDIEDAVARVANAPAGGNGKAHG